MTVEGSDVIPDREAVEMSVSLSSEEDPPGEGSRLHSADGTPSEELPSHDTTTPSCK